MIVVEGCDGTGKSTLVKKICETFDLQEGQRSTLDRDKLYETVKLDTFKALAHAASGIGTLVWDRFFWSELVYARIARKEQPRFTLEQAMYCQNLVSALRCPIIVCMPPFAEVQRNVMGTLQMEGVHANLQQIYEAYDDLMRENGKDCQIVRYDYTKPWAWYEVCYHVERYLYFKESLWT